MPGLRGSSNRSARDNYRFEIETSLRGLLREHRRYLGDPAFDNADKEETAIKDLERRLKVFEDVLKEEPPDAEFLDIFEELLKELQTSISDFEDKLHALGAQEAAKQFGNPSEGPSERYLKLLHSFEDVLHAEGDLLASFEALLHRFKTPPEGAVASFETLLHGFSKGLKSFEDLLHQQPLLPLADDLVFLDSFWTLLRQLEKLLKSFEDLIKASAPTNVELVASFSELLGDSWRDPLAELLESFATLVQEHIPMDPDFNLTPEDEALIKDYETLLHGDEELLESFACLVKEHAKKHPELLKQFEAQLAELEERLGEFEKMIKGFAPQNKPLIQSFEDLLHGLVELLTKFKEILEETDKKNAERIESFESLIRGLEERLDSFEDILKALKKPDLDLTLSFESLIHALADLLEDFEKLRGGAAFPNPERVALSHKDLNDGYQKLQQSLATLKKGFNPVPEELVLSNLKVDDKTVTLLERFLRGLRRASPAEASAFTRSVSKNGWTLIDLCGTLLRQRPLSRRVVTGFRDVVSHQRRLVAAIQSTFARQAQSSVFLQDALEDVAWLQEQLEERTKQLRR
jgi:tetratricopeptide (TPR) repeat protein